MPPKKSAAAKADAGASEDGNKPFSWTPENERKLFLLMIGTTSFSGEDNERFAQHVFKGTSGSAIRQRANKIRAEHRQLYEAYGWTPPDGKTSAAKGAGTPKGKKRGAKEAGEGDEEVASPAAKKGRKGKEVERDVPDNDLKGAVKKEDEEDEEEIKI